eukprot:12133816-Heterocapsa_arctica.AAC.1
MELGGDGIVPVAWAAVAEAEWVARGAVVQGDPAVPDLGVDRELVGGDGEGVDGPVAPLGG